MKTVVFMVGAGGSGKSFVIKNDEALKNLEIVNSDNFIESHPDYLSGAKQPHQLHEWASEQMETQWDAMLQGDESFILDGTGKTRANVEARVAAARAAGFKVKMIWVFVPMTICLQRNAKRKRNVPAEVIQDAWRKVASHWESYHAIADDAIVIRNH
jgi:predicted kinase